MSVGSDKPVLLVFMGMVASGKSYLAEAVTKKLCCPHYNSDVIRKELAGFDADSRQWLPLDSGIYSPEFSRKTYDEMVVRAVNALSAEDVVVLDGTYSKRQEREIVISKLNEKCKVLFIYCFCSESVSYARLDIRKDDDQAVSDGRPLIYEHQLKTFDLPVELAECELLQLDTDCDISVLLETVCKRVKS